MIKNDKGEKMESKKVYQLLMDYVHKAGNEKEKYIKRDWKAYRFIEKLVNSKRIDSDEESNLSLGMVEMIENVCLILSECKFLTLDYRILDYVKDVEHGENWK